MIRGRFITLEGIEGAGKSSLQARLADALSERGRRVCVTREPGGTPLAEDIRALVLKRREEPMPPVAEVLLMFAARNAHVENRIRPALARGEWVLCDRFTDATRAYQGGGRGLDSLMIEQLATLTHPRLQPDLTLLLDLPPQTGLSRARGRQEAGDRFEDETLSFFSRVRERYLALAAAEPDRIHIIDATQDAQSVLAQALAAVEAVR
ncbi:MAG: dTMP kinase [Nevskiaceae bacterium]|jgi:dTMP kinase|nr:dTMP kinase [Nevskiaceae bacterium]